MLWVAGFDIIYSCQDFEFDKKYGLHSMVVRFGIPSALKISRIMHGLMILLLLYFGYLTNLGFIFIIGVIISAIMLIYEHSLVKPNDLSKINIAFFNINGLVSILLFLMTGLDILL
jgi:4-hydroxybenzoate polyprenyltransferase